MEDKLIAVDLDDTLCKGKFWEVEPEPIQEMIDIIWDLYKRRAHIVIYTSRQGRYYLITHAWLIKYDVPFHGICMQMKPSADYYLDDRAIII
ncbi:MAG: hypothetical protein AABY15_03870 [Nanoarchaeota archaeon]